VGSKEQERGRVAATSVSAQKTKQNQAEMQLPQVPRAGGRSSVFPLGFGQGERIWGSRHPTQCHGAEATGLG